MIGCFPDLYRDESFYSGCARYQERIAFSSNRYAVRSLFGHRVRRLDVNLPRHLGQFVACLPPGHSLSVETIVEKHTVLPYYRAFRGGQWAKRVEEVITEEKQKWGGYAVSSPDMLGKSIAWMRYCLRCVEEDRHRVGEAYWHRLHQVPGYVVCPSHGVFLQESAVRSQLRQPHEELMTAERAIAEEGVADQELNPKKWEDHLFLRLAQDIDWIFSNATEAFSEGLQAGYLTAFAEHNLMTAKGHLKRRTLFQGMLKTYRGEVLSRLGCATRDLSPRYCIEIDILRVPLRHLLTIQFLGHTAESFAALCRKAPAKSLPSEPVRSGRDQSIQEPFGKGPWPCMNKASEHFHQPVVTRCCIHVDKRGRVIGEFSCSCGFVFTRRGPDRCSRDRVRVGKMRCFGAVWDQQLRRLWEDSSLSIVSMAKALGVDYVTMKRQAVRLRLTFPPRKRAVRLPPPYKPTHGGMTSDLNVSRDAMLRAVQQYPGENRQFFHNLLPGLYGLLWRRDRQWLDRHLPSTSVDWSERDKAVEKIVRDAVKRLYTNPGRPLPITRQRILREGHLHALPRAARGRMPLTEQALREAIEPWEALAVRRIKWLSDYVRHATPTQPLTYTLIRDKLGLNSKKLAHPRVVDAMHSVINSPAWLGES